MEFNTLGKYLLIFGGILMIAGLVFMLADKIPFLGRLPGDILIRRKNFTFYFPIVTSIIVSIILSILLNLFFRK